MSSMKHQQQCEGYGKDEMVVNYHDACIFGRDLALLQSPTGWLNDSCIHFYMTFLQQQEQEQQQTSNTTPRTLYMDASVISFLMHQCDDEDDLIELGRGACQNFSPDINRLVIPINNLHNNSAASRATWATPNSGMHWSLLVIILFHQQQENAAGSNNDFAMNNNNNNDDAMFCCLHIDSVDSSGNLHAARAVASKILEARNKVLLTRTKTTTTTLQEKPTIHQVQVHECQNIPRQQNGHDCGVHVLAAAEAISKMSLLVADEVLGDNVLPQQESVLLRQEAYEMAIQNHVGDAVQDNSYCESFRRRIVEAILTAAARS